MIISLALLRNNLCLPGLALTAVSSVGAVRSSQAMILSGCNGLEIGQLAGFFQRKSITLHLDNAPPLLQDNLSSCNEKTRHCPGGSLFLSNIQNSYLAFSWWQGKRRLWARGKMIRQKSGLGPESGDVSVPSFRPQGNAKKIVGQVSR